MFEITSGKLKVAQKVVIYGPEGVGKSSLAAQFPSPIFIDTEGSTTELDVNRLPRPTSWEMLQQEVQYIKNNRICESLVIDTADWAETLAIKRVCQQHNITGIEDIGYGKGYVYATEEFGRLLNKLQEIVEIGINVVLVAHANITKFEQPDEMGAYDRWGLKLKKGTSSLVKEWADMVLFVNYKTQVVNVDGRGAVKGKNKAQGQRRMIYAEHTAAWDAKNRHGLPFEMDLDYKHIAHIFADTPQRMQEAAAQENQKTIATQKTVQQTPREQPAQQEAPLSADIPFYDSSKGETGGPIGEVITDPNELASLNNAFAPDPKKQMVENRALNDLMIANGVTLPELEAIVSKEGYYPEGTSVAAYDPRFVDGVLVTAWNQVYAKIVEMRKEQK